MVPSFFVSEYFMLSFPHVDRAFLRYCGGYPLGMRNDRRDYPVPVFFRIYAVFQKQLFGFAKSIVHGAIMGIYP